MLNKLGVNQN